MITRDQLLTVMPYAAKRIDTFLPHLVATMEEFAINTPDRQAAFLAQVGHESGQLRYVLELASGEDYEGRKDLGNVEDGDGVRFKGRGLIQITGRTNYRACSLALFNDDRLLHFPELLEDPRNACRSAGWYWSSRRLNELADEGLPAFGVITKRINGGLNGTNDRLALYRRAQGVLCA